MLTYAIQKSAKGLECEDAKPVSTEAYSIVCDGLGGSGGRILSLGEEKHTSAYFGARFVSAAVEEYFASEKEEIERIVHDRDEIGLSSFVSTMKERLMDMLSKKTEEHAIEKPIGVTTKIFPTTLASALYVPTDEKISIIVIWAGDSRVYYLGAESGLKLLTKDDTRDGNDHIAGGKDSDMGNLIYAYGDFKLNYAMYEFSEPGFSFCSSDGCFEYLKVPAFLEGGLEAHLLASVDDYVEGSDWVKAFENELESKYYSIIGDDTTACGIFFGLDSQDDVKTRFAERVAKVKENMESILPVLSDYERNKSESMKENATKDELSSSMKKTIRDVVSQSIRDGSGLFDDVLKTIPAYNTLSQKLRDMEKAYEIECSKLSERKRNAIMEAKDRIARIILPYYLDKCETSTDIAEYSLEKLERDMSTFEEMLDDEEFTNGVVHILSEFKNVLAQYIEKVKTRKFPILNAFYNTSHFDKKRKEAYPAIAEISEKIFSSVDDIPDYIPKDEKENISRLVKLPTEFDQMRKNLDEKHIKERDEEISLFTLVNRNQLFSSILESIERCSLPPNSLGQDFLSRLERYRECQDKIIEQENECKRLEKEKEAYSENIAADIRHIGNAIYMGAV